jgi:crotonobetainyl-CoA:carnitine CoA-transferase CaiB-like acyl-CoA transferase
MVDGSGQARGGLASVTGTLEEPALAGAVVADSAGALLLALAVMTALVSRERYGVGQRVDISALGGQLWLQSWELAHASMTGFVPTAQGPHHPIFAGVYGMYRTSDDRGLFIAGIANPDDWEALCRFGGLMDVCRDPRWDTNQKRTGFDPSISYEEVNALRPRLKEAFAQRSLADWEEFLHTRPDIIFHRVQDYREVLADQQVVANGYLAEVDVFKSGPQRLVGNVVGMSVTPGSVKGGPPMLGEHTEAVLGQVGYSLAEVTAIRDEAKIGLVRKLPGMNLKPSD